MELTHERGHLLVLYTFFYINDDINLKFQKKSRPRPSFFFGGNKNQYYYYYYYYYYYFKGALARLYR